MMPAPGTLWPGLGFGRPRAPDVSGSAACVRSPGGPDQGLGGFGEGAQGRARLNPRRMERGFPQASQKVTSQLESQDSWLGGGGHSRVPQTCKRVWRPKPRCRLPGLDEDGGCREGGQRN